MEAKTVATKLKEFKFKSWSLLDNEVYLINREWMKKWKVYVAYKKVKRGGSNQHYSAEHLK